MTDQQAFEYVKDFLENGLIGNEIITPLSDDAKIAITINHEIEACLTKANGKATVSVGPATDVDFHFILSAESIRQFKSSETDNLAEFSIQLLQQILLHNVELHVHASWLQVLKHGYLKLIIAAGGPFLEFLASLGLTNLAKIRLLLASLRKGE